MQDMLRWIGARVDPLVGLAVLYYLLAHAPPKLQAATLALRPYPAPSIWAGK